MEMTKRQNLLQIAYVTNTSTVNEFLSKPKYESLKYLSILLYLYIFNMLQLARSLKSSLPGLAKSISPVNNSFKF